MRTQSVRQFFVARGERRRGIGRQAFALLRRHWGAREVTLDVLLHNERAVAFWRSVGFFDYGLQLRLRAQDDAVDGPS